ncbi:MAG: hypothetical protein H6Q88_1231 [Anaeromyxobacteraceae bacterium]|nr:hypothetical protein [Anaeromyxobacteraceae bacterium]
MKHEMAKKMVLFSVIGTIVAMIFMASSIVYPHPMLLVLAMSIGQGIAIFALVLYLLAVALDLQSSGGVYIAGEETPAIEEPPPAGGSGTPST